MSTLTLTDIWIYPIKSLGGIRLEKAKFKGKGLQYDRRWMLIDHERNFLTQRNHPEMALFKLDVEGEDISVTIKKDENDVATAKFPIHPSMANQSFSSKIWDDEVLVREVDPAISQWFSQHLGITCQLVYFPEENPRPVEEQYQVNNDQVSLADAYPFLIIGQSSLDDLNGRLKEAVPMNRFRPNFVFTGGNPYAEDDWSNLSIGPNKFVAVKKCARCTVPNVDQDTGLKGKEPLRTLSKYRSIDNTVFFGKNLISQNEGEVAVGDAIILS